MDNLIGDKESPLLVPQPDKKSPLRNSECFKRHNSLSLYSKTPQTKRTTLYSLSKSHERRWSKDLAQTIEDDFKLIQEEDSTSEIN